MKPRILIAALLFFAATISYTGVRANAAAVYALNETEVTSLLDADAEVYARIFSENTALCADERLTDAIFVLPLTYYVKVTAYSPESCRVAYCYEDYDYARSVYGYVSTALLTFVAAPPTGRSFPNIFPEFEGNGTFYKNNRFETYYAASDPYADAFFYGYYYRGAEKYCYVLRGGKFGYYSADVFGRIEVPPHADPKPLEKSARESESAAETSEKSGFFASDVNKVIFIAVTCVIAVSAVYLVFLPKKRSEPLPGEDEEFETDE
ncbi:MAG: hypothetical protein IJR61_01475 [Clostridia bacterium]|nr:hypothetical protein [Clostridia bacterium]